MKDLEFSSANWDGHIKDRVGDNFIFEIGKEKYAVEVGEIADEDKRTAAMNAVGNDAREGTAVAIDGGLYVFDQNGNLRIVRARELGWNNADYEALMEYVRAVTIPQAAIASGRKSVPAYHSGGFVGGIKSNEQFAKLLNGEHVSTPAQMDNFMKNILPKMVSRSNSVQYNAPLIEIKCGTVDKSTLPDLKQVVDQAVAKIEKNMESALSRTGYKKKI